MNPRITGQGLKTRGSSDQSSEFLDTLEQDLSQAKGAFFAQLSDESIPAWANQPLADLRQDQNADFFWSDLFVLGQEAEKLGAFTLATQVYLHAKKQAPQASLRREAQEALAGLTGEGASMGGRLEHLSYHWLEQATEPTMLLGMLGAGLAYQGGRALTWGQLHRAGWAESFGGWGQKGLAAAGGFFAEVPAFVFVSKGTQQILGGEISWGMPEVQQELLGSAIVLGALKLSGFGGQLTLNKLHGIDGVVLLSGPRRLGGIYPVTQKLIPQGAMLAGIMGGHQAQAAYFHQDSPEFFISLLDGIATLMQFQAAAKMTPHLAPRLNRLTQELNGLTTRHQDALIRGPQWGGPNLALAGIFGGAPNAPENFFPPYLLMESRGGPVGKDFLPQSRQGRTGKSKSYHLETLMAKKPIHRRRALARMVAHLEALPSTVLWEFAVTVLDHAVTDVGSVRRIAKKALPRITQALTKEGRLEPWLERVIQVTAAYPKSGIDRVLRRWIPAENKLRSQFAALSDLYDKVFFLSELASRGRLPSGPRYQILYETLLKTLEPSEQKLVRDEVEVSFRFPDELTLQSHLDSMDPETLFLFETEFRSKYLVDHRGKKLALDRVPPRVAMILGEIDLRWRSLEAPPWAPWLRGTLSSANDKVLSPGDTALPVAKNPQNLVPFIGYGKSVEFQRAMEKFYSLRTITEKGEWLHEFFREHEGSALFMDLLDELQGRLSWKQQIQIIQIGLLRFWQEASPDFQFLFKHNNLRDFQSQYELAHQLFLTDTQGNRLSREESLPEARNFLERLDHHLEELKNVESSLDGSPGGPNTPSGQVIELFGNRRLEGPREGTSPEPENSSAGAAILPARAQKLHGLEPWRHLPADHAGARAKVEALLRNMDSPGLWRLQKLSLNVAGQPWLVAGVSDGLGFHFTLALLASGLMSRGVGVFYENPQLLEWKDPVRLNRLAQAQALAEVAGEFGVEFYLHFTDMAVADSKNGDRKIPGDILQSLRLTQLSSEVSEINFFDAIVASRGLSAAKGVHEPLRLPSVDAQGRVILTELPKYSPRHFRGTFDGMGRNHGLLLQGLSEFFGSHTKSFFPTWAAGSQNFRGLKAVYAGSVLGEAKVRAERDTLQFHLASEDWAYGRGRHKTVRYPSFLSHALTGIPGAGAFGRMSKAVLSEQGLYQNISQLALRTLEEAYDGTHHWDHPLAAIELDAAEMAYMPQIENRLEIFWQRVGDYLEKNPHWEGQALDSEISARLLQGLIPESDLNDLP